MNIFQLIKKVLDGEFQRIPASSRAERIKIVDARHKDLTSAYKDLTDEDVAPPDYRDPATRFAYIYKYTTCHADIVYNRIASSEHLAKLFDGDDWLKISCIGGGPGSDFLGVLKYALRKDKSRTLKCFLLDREDAWGDTWSEVEQHTEELPFRLSTHFQKLDVTAEATWATQTKYRSAHLFTFVYFLSEIYRSDVAAQPFFKELVKHAESGAYFLFIDNDSSEFRGQIERFSEDYGLRQLSEDSIKYQTDTNEEKRDLDPYYTELRDNPKIRAQIYSALMIKE